MISVLLPTRMRPERLSDSIASLLERAAADVEILIAIDPDDPTEYPDAGELLHGAAGRLTVTPERFGYGRLHDYYNLLAAQATGDWLLLWNDDCLMTTDRWDEIIESYPQTKVLSTDTWHRPLCTFPVIPRSFTEAVGHYSLILHVDTWWQDVAHKLGILEWIPVFVDHQRFDHTGEQPDQVYDQRDFQLHSFYQPEMQKHHDADVEKIRALIGTAP